MAKIDSRVDEVGTARWCAMSTRVYDGALDPENWPGRFGAGCLAHARRKFDEPVKAGGSSSVADEALRRMARIWRLEREFAGMEAGQRLAARQELAKPLWQDLLEWLQLERARVADGGATAKAIDYSLNNWQALTRDLHNGDVPVSTNHLENLMRPWAVERKAWLFCGSELAGQRAAMVMNLLQSANCAATIRMPNCVTCCSACPSVRIDSSTNCCRTVGNRRPDRVRRFRGNSSSARSPGWADISVCRRSRTHSSPLASGATGSCNSRTRRATGTSRSAWFLLRCVHTRDR